MLPKHSSIDQGPGIPSIYIAPPQSCLNGSIHCKMSPLASNSKHSQRFGPHVVGLGQLHLENYHKSRRLNDWSSSTHHGHFRRDTWGFLDSDQMSAAAAAFYSEAKNMCTNSYVSCEKGFHLSGSSKWVLSLFKYLCLLAGVCVSYCNAYVLVCRAQLQAPLEMDPETSQILAARRFFQKKSTNRTSNHHHVKNPSYYDSYHSTENANTTMIPQCNILSLMLYQLVCSAWATLSPTTTYLVLCQYERFFTLSATPTIVAAHTTSKPWFTPSYGRHGFIIS